MPGCAASLVIKPLFFTAVFLIALSRVTTVFPAELLLFAGAGVRQPTDRLIDLFEKETGHRVCATYAGSGQLMSAILTAGRGDLFLPGALLYIRTLEAKDLIHSFRRLMAHTPVIGVNHHKRTQIRSIDDLALPDVRVALGDPRAMAFGRVAQRILFLSPLKTAILKNVVVYGATVKQLTLYVAQGDADAAIIGRADAFQFRDRIQMVPIPEAYTQSETIAVAVLNATRHLEAACRFRDFMASPRATAVFEAFGFLPLHAGTEPEGTP